MGKNDVNDRLRRGELGDHREGAVDPTGEWETPEPLTADAGELPAFPVEVLPEWMGGYVAEVAHDTQTDASAAAVIGLACLAAALAKRCRVQVKPSWTEGLNLYTAVAMKTGEGKGPVYDAMTGPILTWEREQREIARPAVRAAKVERKAMEGRLAHLLGQASRAKRGEDRDHAREEAKQVQAALDAQVVPAAADVMTSDVTPEKLKNLLATNDGRIALMSSEGVQVFSIMTGLYNRGQDNLGVYLEGYSDARILVHRLGREPDDIPYPALTMALAIQPEVLQRLSSKPQTRDLGLLARFLWAIPKPRLGDRDVTQPPTVYQWRDAYTEGMRALLNLPTDPSANDKSRWRLLKLSRGALELHTGFRGWLEPRMGPHGEYAEVTDVAGKLAGRVARIAALLHCAERAGWGEPWSEAIEPATMDAAIQIGRWSLPHALSAMGLTVGGQDAQLVRAIRVRDWIGKQDADWLGEDQLYHGIRNWWRCTKAEFRSVVEVLEAHGYIRREPKPSGPKGGRPSFQYAINPLWVAGREAA